VHCDRRCHSRRLPLRTMATNARTTAARSVSRLTGQRMRFPCGHTEAQASVARRVHERPRALIVSCRQCNVVVLVVAPR